ncbi:tetratricopeptide repeat protein [Niastella sp. OAS944]|uniref:tetratricopeptide repeat protein n=1 Tax=Niastella sp. OAS944 TaxID=2664089 RepID=UPI003497A2BC|nr:tetratricopeptide (TPR) repeat protein [Chitinophagaceae bacterium OAS944]
MKYIYLSLLIILTACQQPITNPKDYSRYLQPTQNTRLQQIDEELGFWQNKLNKAPGDIISENKIAGLYTRRFSYSGNINEIHCADSLYRQVNYLNHTTSSGTFRSLAANCITQHRFLQAKQYIDSALALGDDKYLTVLMEFDVAMELGDKYRAKKALNSITDKSSFDYLIRQAKYKDHVEGDLDAAISLMEMACDKIKDTHNPSLYCWIRSNLGDFYGHANRYQLSYKCYLDVLATDPHYYHALKGIAWLAFSHDKDVANARKIVAYLKLRHPVPDYDLLLSQMAAVEKDSIQYKQHITAFMAATGNRLYGGMYNKYRFNIEANDMNDAAGSLHIALEEVAHRPTPEAYSWLAWAYCRNGQVSKAITTAQAHVIGKCFEPGALFYLGKIYQAGGDNAKARKYLTTAQESSYELGPVISGRIAETLKTL